MANFGVGDVVVQAPAFGAVRKVRVTHKHQAMANGKPGFWGKVVGRNGADTVVGWGWDSQVVAVVAA